jgi:hypothetical protein
VVDAGEQARPDRRLPDERLRGCSNGDAVARRWAKGSITRMSGS